MISAKRCRAIAKKHHMRIASGLNISVKTLKSVKGVVSTKTGTTVFGHTSWYQDGRIIITIYNQKHKSEREVLMTLYHELLHIKLSDLGIKLPYMTEECFVSGIEHVTKYLLHGNLKI